MLFTAKNGWLDVITTVALCVCFCFSQVEVAGCTPGTLGRLIYEPKLARINGEEEEEYEEEEHY